MESQVKPHHDSEEAGASTPCSPEHLLVLGFACVAQVAVGIDVVDGRDVLACRADHATVPAEAALQEVPAERDPSAVADREEEPLLHQGLEQIAPPDPWPGGSGHRTLVNRQVGESRQIDNDTAVPHVVPGPAMAPRSHADVLPICFRGSDGRDHIVD